MTAYRPLPLHPLAPGASYFRPQPDALVRVSLDSPAVSVMTDLARVAAITIGPNASIDAAHGKMVYEGVHLLLVTDLRRDVLGLITATDIQGEKPMQFLEQRGGTHRDILVQDIMTPHERLEVLLMHDVLQAKVGDIVATLTRVGRQHAVVSDDRAGEALPVIRGIFSSTQIARQLGMPVNTVDVAQTFAEVEIALNT